MADLRLLSGLVLLVACGGDLEAPARASKVVEPSAGVQAPAIQDGPLVVFLGDSLSAGYGLPAEDAFPAVLARLLTEQGVPLRVVNAGVSGDTSVGGLRRLEWVLSQEPDVLVIELGGNDGLRGLPLEMTYSALRDIVLGARQHGAEVLLVGMQMPPNYGPEYASEFREIYSRLAEELNVALVPFLLEGVGGVEELNLPDGIHPTAEGHRRVAETLRPYLADVLRSLSEDRGPRPD